MYVGVCPPNAPRILGPAAVCHGWMTDECHHAMLIRPIDASKHAVSVPLDVLPGVALRRCTLQVDREPDPMTDVYVS
jgi:hypothetical protein